MPRVSPSVFKIPTDKLRAGYYSDRYFVRTREVLLRDKRRVTVSYQFFVRADGIVCGLDEAIAFLKMCTGFYSDEEKAKTYYAELRKVQWQLQKAGAGQSRKKILKWERQRTGVRQKLNRLWKNRWSQLQVYALQDGEAVKKNEPVMAVIGDPRYFAHLETPLLGVIARPTATATAVHKVVKAARGKQILFFSARFDHYWIQASDGYAAYKAGAFGVSTDANADYWGGESLGTIPHALIGAYAGDTVESFLAFDRHMESGIHRVALVDWDNDCIGTTRKLVEKLIQTKYGFLPGSEKELRRYAPSVIGSGKGRLWGVRFDTSEKLRDRSVRAKNSMGVCPELVHKARKAFDRWGCRRLKIVVSGGFDEKKIRLFEKNKIPADIYGIGSSLLRNRIDVTADIVEFEGKPCAKVGRRRGNWSRLRRVY